MSNRTLAVIDALRDVMPLPDGVTADETAALPAKYLAGHLYAWPDTGLPQKLEERNGRWPEADLRVRFLLAIANRAEQRGAVESRARSVTDALATWLDDAHAAIEAAARSALWWDCYIEAVKYDAVRSIEVRGIGIVVVVRLIPDAPIGS